MSRFLKAFKVQFFYYKKLAENSFEQLTDEEFFKQFDETNNSVALLVSHLGGNMLSRWTHFRTEDGEKIWRKRDGEFEIRGRSREDLMDLWNRAWEVATAEIENTREEDLNEIIYIRNEGHTITEAFLRQSNHLAYHVGQILHQAKLLKIKDFQCQSIPYGKSEEYFQKKFAENKGIRNFTERIWKKE